MIQAISTANVQNKKQAAPLRQQSFKAGMPVGPCVPERKNSFSQKIAWTAEQFAKGAVISTVICAISDGISALAKKPPVVGSFKNYAKEAGKWGIIWVGVGLVFEAFDSLHAKKR